MTDNEETLIEQLLDEDHNWHSAACAKAATQLQALAAVIEADREAVRADQAQADERLQREARLAERAAIVAWLRSHDFMALNDAADLIEAGEYLK